jgi:hypothetical protein
MEIVAFIAGGIFLLLLLARAIGGGWNSPEAIGSYGEARTAKYLGRLPSEVYTIFHDLTIADSNGRTTQIDHVVVSRYGIFVIETKCYKGWIFGSEKSKVWTQSLCTGRGWFSSSEKHKFQNPIRQNWRHIYVLAERLKVPKNCFHNVVVFAGDAEIKTEVPDYVMSEYDVSGYIMAHNQILLNERIESRICAELERLNISNEEGQTTLHVQSLQDRYAPVTSNSAAPRCPRCGSEMRKRYRRSDSKPFYGCSQYPKCKGTINIED